MPREPTGATGSVTSTPRPIVIEAPDAEAMKPFGWMLGKPFPAQADPSAFSSPKTAFWRQHLFDPGEGGQVEVLWVEYYNDDPMVESLEQHHHTQQAVVPLTGSIVQILAVSGADGAPDLRSIRAYQLHPGLGFCMRPGIWHAARSAAATCLMLTRASTTVDLVKHLKRGGSACETALALIQPIRLIEI